MKLAWIGAIYLVVSQIVFLVNIQFPADSYFDETNYVAAAKALYDPNTNLNWEHPPLAKAFMHLGITIGGDRPFGWRLMSSVFGGLTLVGMVGLGFLLFGTWQAAAATGAITLANQLLYVQARIAMQDVFMMCFLVWALYAFCKAWKPTSKNPQETLQLLVTSGLLFGFATACKWYAIVPGFFCALAVAAVYLLQRWRAQFQPVQDPWYSPTLFSQIHPAYALGSLTLVPLAAYILISFGFYLTKTSDAGIFTGFIAAQERMFSAQTEISGKHPYSSQWYSWPLMLRPIWYAFISEGEWKRGVLMLGNPLIMWGGLVALFFCLRDWVKTQSRPAFLALFTYSALLMAWVLIPRKVSFYYYYFPAGMMLSLALVQCLRRWPLALWGFTAVSVLLFIWYAPILGAFRIPADSYMKWMWFRSWI